MRMLVTLVLCGLSITALAQSKYSNTKYGVSFQYPKEYEIKEGDLVAETGI